MSDKNNTFVGHNICQFDIPQLEKLLDTKVEAKLVDTLALSWYLYPKRLRHGLDVWGDELGWPKVKVDDWHNLSYEEYRERCETDVDITHKLFEKQIRDLNWLYEHDQAAIERVMSYLTWKVKVIADSTPIKVDIEKVKEAIQAIKKELDLRTPQLIENMPMVEKYVYKTRPAKPFKKDGSYSAHGEKWFSLLEERGLPKDYDGAVKVLHHVEEPNPGSVPQVKDWLFSLGWEPETFDYKRNKETGEVRKIPQIKSKDDGEELCPSVLKLAEKIPAVKLFAGFGIMRDRLSVLKGFLKYAEQNDGCLKQEINGFTNTLRFRHKAPLVNLPKVGTPWGGEIRGSLVSRDGYEFCGSDQSSLEDRCKLHYMWDYDPEYVKEQSTPGFDPHLDLAKHAGAMDEEMVEAHKKGTSDYTSIRHKFKTTNYACTYGASAATIARSAGVKQSEGKQLHTAYWARNWAIKKIADDAVVKTSVGVNWIWNPVSKMWIWLKTEKDRFSSLNQSTGVYCFDLWVRNILSRRPQISAQFHDEVLLEIKQGNREACTTLLNEAQVQTNKRLKLNIELGCGIDFGPTYASVH